MQTTYSILRAKIAAAPLAEIESREAQAMRHYNAGTISEKEYARLTVFAMERTASLETK